MSVRSVTIRVSLCLLGLAGGPWQAVWAQRSPAEVVRFLEQSTFGPNQALINHIQKDLGGDFGKFLDEQFAMDLPNYPDYGFWPQNPPGDCDAACRTNFYTMYQEQSRFFSRALNDPDQLRQRVAFALNQIVVVSAENPNLRQVDRMLPYLQILDQDAFGNFRDLLYDITLNPAMGRYLDMVGNNKNNPNENYAREILQLFSVGLDLLNPDGTPQTDNSGNRIPTYDQTTITNFARVFTGWNFANPPMTGIVNYYDPMVVQNANAHDTNPKTLLNGQILPAGQTAAQDLSDALDNIFNHPNVGPFIGKNLIQHLVTSNPSPDYVSRITAVFNDNGSGVRGDLQAVVRAILLDREARGFPVGPNAGHLKEPVLWITNLLRAFDTGDTSTDYVLGEQFLPGDIAMDENLFNSPTVFNFFPPDYVIPGETLLGPEFNIQSTATSLARINLAWEVVFHRMPTGTYRPSGTWLDATVLGNLPADPQTLINYLNTLMLHGSMSLQMHDRILSAISGMTDPVARAQEAIYQVASSAQYSIQR